MGREYHFRPGSFYRVSDRTGFPTRAEDTIKQWDNLIVERSTFETRQPQDLVRGVKDQQSVQDARPLSPAQFVGPVWTTTSYAVPIGESVIPVTSLSSFSIGDKVAIMTDRDGGTLAWGIIVDVGILSFAPDAGYLTTEAPGYYADGGYIATEASAIITTEISEYIFAPNGNNIRTDNALFITTEIGQYLLLDEGIFVPAIEIEYTLAYPVSSGAQVWNYGPVA